MIVRISAILACVLLIASTDGAAAQRRDVVVENDALIVSWSVESAEASIKHKAGGGTFVRRLRLGDGTGVAKVVAAGDPKFGDGQAIEITHADGDQSLLKLFADSPFVLLSGRLRNESTEPRRENRIGLASYAIDLNKAPTDLRTFGTGGLLSVADNPGSYAWLAVVDPESRAGVVSGWLTHDRASGVLFSRLADELATVDARSDYGRLAIAPGADEPLETLAIGYFDDARLGLEAWADAVAEVYDVQLPPQPTGYCTWYSRPHGGASDEQHLAELARFASQTLAPAGFSVVQIDDKWQAGVSNNGPRRNFTTHDPEGPYPHGMQAAAEHITSLGLTPGLWYMPFAGTYYDPFFEDRTSWFVQRENGEPYETAWGGTCLDLTHSEVRDYVRSVADRVVNQWGFRYLKLDGLWTGTATKQQYVNSGYKEDGMGDAVFNDPSVTNIEAYRSGLQLVREAVGRETFLLGCNGPQNMRSYGGAFGLVDAMRIGPDNGSDWERLTRGPIFGSRHYFLHGRVWYNDPDPVYVRSSMPLQHARLVCSWVAITGQLNMSSEWLPGLPAERLEILKRSMPSHGLLPRPIDLFENDPPRLWLLTDSRREPRRDVLGVFNWNDQAREFDVSLDRLGLDDTVVYEAFESWSDELLTPIARRLKLTVPAQSCRIVAVRPARATPQLLSSSRHVTQGIVDVREEQWDDANQTLRGVSSVVGGDPYELRIVMPRDGDWKARSISASSSNRDSEMEAALTQDGHVIRACVESAMSGDVQWEVEFTR